MKLISGKKLLIIFISLVWFSTHSIAQSKTYKTSTALILGYENDTIFKASCAKTLISLNTKTNEVKITIFTAEIHDDHPRVDTLFRKLRGDIILETTINPDLLTIEHESVLMDVYENNVLVTLNGVSKTLTCRYRVNFIKTNNIIHPEKKFSINLFINPEDFDIRPPFRLGNPIEIEIEDGILNEQP